MLEVKVEDEIAAPPAKVWELASDFGGVQRWSPSVGSCTVEGSGVGAVRTIDMGGMTIRERLEALEPAARTLSYSIVEAPMPLTNYLATIRIDDAGNGRSRVTWSSRFEAGAMGDDQARQMVEMIYRQGIAGFRKALT